MRQPDKISVESLPERRKIENTPELSALRIKQRKRSWIPISRALIDDSPSSAEMPAAQDIELGRLKTIKDGRRPSRSRDYLVRLPFG